MFFACLFFFFSGFLLKWSVRGWRSAFSEKYVQFNYNFVQLKSSYEGVSNTYWNHFVRNISQSMRSYHGARTWCIELSINKNQWRKKQECLMENLINQWERRDRVQYMIFWRFIFSAILRVDILVCSWLQAFFFLFLEWIDILLT